MTDTPVEISSPAPVPPFVDGSDFLASLRRRVPSSGEALPKVARRVVPQTVDFPEVIASTSEEPVDNLSVWLGQILTDHGVDDVDLVAEFQDLRRIEGEVDLYQRALAEVPNDLDLDHLEEVDDDVILDIPEDSVSWDQFLCDLRLEDHIYIFIYIYIYIYKTIDMFQ